MLQSSAKRFKSANVGDNVIIPIERPDRMNYLDNHSLLYIQLDSLHKQPKNKSPVL